MNNVHQNFLKLFLLEVHSKILQYHLARALRVPTQWLNEHQLEKQFLQLVWALWTPTKWLNEHRLEKQCLQIVPLWQDDNLG